jgi:hypothetical protein
LKDIRTHLKNVFWPNIFVGASFQILDNQQVACGLKLGPAAILNQNPIFEMGYRKAACREIPIVAERSALLFIDVQNYNARPDGGNYKNQVQMPGK